MHDGERRILLQLARDAIACRLHGRPAPVIDPPPGPLGEERGAFVTLTLDGALRGCIGHVVGTLALWETVRENAVNAAFHDPRFPAVTPAELDRVTIEISALSPLCAVSSPDEIEVGRHGLMIRLGAARGLLLPQVASDLGWDRLTFLSQTCRKAGLDRDAWRRPDAVLEVFEAEVFGEIAETDG
jgi:AmmeMemoRadiSam system protein A